MIKRWFIVPLILFLTACGSTPRSDYYMLSTGTTSVPSGGGPSIGVGPIQVPEYLQRREMILNRDHHKLSVNEYHRWAEPLEAGITRVMTLNLASLLNTHEVQTFPWRRVSPPDYGISISVVQFAVHEREAMLVAEWTVTRPGKDTAPISRISQLVEPSGEEPEQIAAAYSRLLYQLSEEIVEALK